jgi:hypothetical protein
MSGFSIPAIAAQSCDTSKPATAPMSRFKDNGNGTITDQKAKRVWLRCSLGMSWGDSGCEGKTFTYDWNSANETIDGLNAKKVGGHSNWRLPTQEELESIVERQCFKPAIDLKVFPYTPESGFWTKTDAPGISPRAIVVHFIHGQSYVANRKQAWRVRPVADR